MSAHDDYRAIDAVNFSTLKALRESPAHYQEALRAGRAGEGDTRSRGMLRAVHTLVLEPDVFRDDYAVWDGGSRRTNAYKAWSADVGDRTELTEKEHADAVQISGAVLANPDALAVLTPGDGWSVATEITMLWTDDETGLACKGRADIVRIHPVHGAQVYDLKTVQSNAPRLLSAMCARMAWHVQAAHYAAGVQAMLRKVEHPAAAVPVRAGLVCVESRRPHDVAVWNLDGETTLWAGEKERAALLSRLAECTAAGEWPGRHDGPQTLYLPSWAYDDTDDDAGFWESDR